MLSEKALSFLSKNVDYEQFTIGVSDDDVKNNVLTVDLLKNRLSGKKIRAIYWKFTGISKHHENKMCICWRPHDEIVYRYDTYYSMCLPHSHLATLFDDPSAYMYTFVMYPELHDEPGQVVTVFTIHYGHLDDLPLELNNATIDVVVQY